MKYCYRPFEHAYIFPNGDVRACGWTYQKIGNLLEEDLEQIWNSDAAQKIREYVKDQTYKGCNKVVCPLCNNDTLEDISESDLAAKQASEIPMEYNVAIDYICNHSCPSCRHEIFQPDAQYISNLKYMIDKILPYLNKARRISTDGNGDCFASPYIMDLLTRLHPENTSFELDLETNGVLCDKEHLDRISHLLEYTVGVTVTPNSFEKETYRYLSGGHDNLSKLIDNLYLIKEYRKANLINRFEISIVVQDTNYRELPSFVHRCLEDFECDRVVIKPVFYWFCLTPEEYWFKDILNPKHPYFDDYMEVLKDPILKDERVYFWGGHDAHKPKEHPAYDYKRYFDVFASILKNDYPEQVLEKALLDKGADKVAIYGTNDMAEMMYYLLKRTKIEVVGFIDRDAKEDWFCDMPITRLDAFKPDMVQTILVSNFAYLTNITRDLRFRDYQGELIPFNMILEKD